VPEFVSGDWDESNFSGDVDEDFAFDVDSVELVKSAVRWRNWSNVSPEGSLNFFPDSRKGVRQFNRFISVSPFFAEAVFDEAVIEGGGG